MSVKGKVSYRHGKQPMNTAKSAPTARLRRQVPCPSTSNDFESLAEKHALQSFLGRG